MAQNIFNMQKFITQLSRIYHRQGAAETEAAALIMRTLDRYKVKYIKEPFTTYIPDFIKAELVVDGKQIPAIPTSFVSGEITDKGAIISSMISSQRFIDDSNINFNPHCHTISRSNHYFAPSLAVAPKHLAAICRAKKVHGNVVVEKQRHRSLNILIGNIKNPQVIVMGHYDSIGPGVIDNASGTAMMMYLAIQHPEILNDVLIVIGGNEELSYDYPLYWGHGYRVFEKKHLHLLQRAQAIVGIDCVGHAPAILYNDPHIVRLGVPLANHMKWQKKVFLLSGDLAQLNPVYHSDADNGRHVPITQQFLNEAIRTFMGVL